MFTEGTVDKDGRSWLAELLCDLRTVDRPQLRLQVALSIWHIARATLECEVRRGALSWWLNQYAETPGNRLGEDAGHPGRAESRRACGR